MKYEIPEEYFFDEVRDGFFVPSMIKKSWAVSFKNYLLLSETLGKNGGKCHVFFGNLIGAIRHGGNIPWDDDIDTIVFREDYNKLKETADKGELPEDHYLRDYNSMENGNLVRKWMDANDALKSEDRWDEDHGFKYVNNVDIFIFDHIPDSQKNVQYFTDVIDLCQHVHDFAEMLEQGKNLDAEDEDEFAYSLDLLQRVLKTRYLPDRDGALTNWVWKVMENFLSGYSARNCEKVSSVPHFMFNHKCCFPKWVFETYVDLPYEFGTVTVPIGYDHLIRTFYGRYVYPVKDGSLHDYPNYRMIEGLLKQYRGLEISGFDYDSVFGNGTAQSEGQAKEGLGISNNDGTEGDGSVSISTTISDVVNALREAHITIEAACAGERFDEAQGVLAGCQDLAVSLGETIEDRGIDCGDIISVLEEYCEKIYFVYQKLSAGEKDAEGINGLKEYEAKIPEAASAVVANDIDNNDDLCFDKLTENKIESLEKTEIKSVVFLVRDAKCWKSLHSLWEAAKADEKVEKVTVIVTPFFIKDGKGELIRENMIIKNEGFPDEVTLTDFDDYSFETEKPDVVIFQEPYDEYGDVYSVHPDLYAARIRMYTNKLVFVPGFTVDEVTPEDQRSRYTLGRYLKNPGPAYADVIFAQSENMKNVFAEILSEMTERIDWTARISGAGVPAKDVECDCVRPESEKKYVLLYQLSVSVLYQYGIEMLEKSRKLIELAKERFGTDMYIRYFEDQNIHKVLKNKKKGLYERYKRFVEELRADDLVTVDESGDVEGAVLDSDGYFGDGSIALTKSYRMKKPVLWQNPVVRLSKNKTTENKWEPEKLIATEGDWSVDDFLDEMVKYTDEARAEALKEAEETKETVGDKVWRRIIG